MFAFTVVLRNLIGCFAKTQQRPRRRGFEDFAWFVTYLQFIQATRLTKAQIIDCHSFNAPRFRDLPWVMLQHDGVDVREMLKHNLR